jgi:hypothetical protein
MAKKKYYITVKCGLIEDSKHREAIGNRIWLYLHILNRCNWDTGQVLEWRDKDEASELDMSPRTLTTQRQELNDLGYISCEQKGNHQIITVHNWTNPRSYSSEILNKKGTQIQVPLEQEGTPKGTPKGTYEGSNEMSTPTLDSNNRGHISSSAKSCAGTELYALVVSISEVCHMDLEANKGALFKEAKLLSKAHPTPTPELIKAKYNGSISGFWKSQWPGNTGQFPKPADIRKTWGQWEVVRQAVGKKSTGSAAADYLDAKIQELENANHA